LTAHTSEIHVIDFYMRVPTSMASFIPSLTLFIPWPYVSTNTITLKCDLKYLLTPEIVINTTSLIGMRIKKSRHKNGYPALDTLGQARAWWGPGVLGAHS
jgi:hypothetical protein